MTCVGKITRIHGTDQGDAGLQGGKDVFLCYRDVFCCEAQVAGTFGHQRPGGSFTRYVITLFFWKLSYGQGIPCFGAGQTTGDHGQAGWTAAGDSKEIAAVGFIPPAFIPLQKIRYLTVFSGSFHFGWNIYRLIVSSLRIIFYKICSLRIFFFHVKKTLRNLLVLPDPGFPCQHNDAECGQQTDDPDYFFLCHLKFMTALIM